MSGGRTAVFDVTTSGYFGSVIPSFLVDLMRFTGDDLCMDDLTDEATYQRVRAAQWQAQGPPSRRTLLRASGGAGRGAAILGPAAGRAAADDPPIVKPLPPELFTVYGTNAETRWEA